MKKILNSIVALMSCFTLCIGLAACGGTGSGGKPSTSNPYTQPQPETVESSGVHSVSKTDSGKKLVENGRTEYKIIAPESDEWNAQTAVSELQYFMKESSGVEFALAEDDTYDENEKYIVVGENAYSESAEITYDRAVLKATGTRILTKGNSIFVGGATTKGTLNAVYEFLSQTVGYEIYTKDTISLDHATNIPLYNYDITEIPDFEYNALGYQSVANDVMTLARMRSMHQVQIFAEVKRSLFHNSFDIVDKNTYGSNTDWYSDDGTQLCYTAHGEEDEYEKLMEVVLSAMKNVITTKPTVDNIPLSMEDNGGWCKCDACAAEKEKYGTDAAVYIKFANDLSDRIAEWIQSDDSGVDKSREIKINIMAYYSTAQAPVKKNADGTYSPIDEDVVVNDGVTVLYAPISAQYNMRIDSAQNLIHYEPFEQWSAICNSGLALWLYQTNFNYYMYPYNSWDYMQDNYRIYNKFHATSIYDQGQSNNGRSTAFSELKIYLSQKLAWNVNCNMEELIDGYFDNVYGPASETMRGMYDSVRLYMKYLESKKNVTGNIYYPIESTDYFPKYVLDKFLGFTEQAKEDIAPLASTDPDAYARILDKIVLESMFPRYALYNNYSGLYSNDLFAELKTAFLADLTSLGITNYRETNGNIFVKIDEWN